MQSNQPTFLQLALWFRLLLSRTVIELHIRQIYCIFDTMKKDFDITGGVSRAVKSFWLTKSEQLKNSSDASNRGSVVGGKQLDGFIAFLRKACISVGVPASCIYEKNNYIPGFFRSSKDWDFLVISPSGKLLVVIELKSQVGSYGNNFNNRAEEAIGNAADFWTAYRERQFPTCGTPWVGFLMMIGLDYKSTVHVKNYSNHYPVLREFEGASYIDRYRILCDKLMSERLYTSTSLIWTKDAETFGSVSDDLAIGRFIHSLQGYLSGCINEFD